MVSSEDIDLFRVFDFKGKEETDGLYSLSSAIDIVSEEEIVGLWWEPSVFEQSEHVVVLSMDVSADLDGGGDFDEHGLFHEY